MKNSDQTKILCDMQSQGYSIIPDCISKKSVSAARYEYFQSLTSEDAHPPLERFKPIDLIEKPWRKFAIGSKTGNGEPYSQLLQTTYFSTDLPDYPILSKAFRRMIEIRNQLTKMPINFGSDLKKGDFWNACRAHHYPCGGGHMAPHKDTLFPKLLADFEFPFIQMLTTLTNRNCDFSYGGGYLVDRNWGKSFFENESNAGSLIIFDGEIVHGVEDVDPDLLLDMEAKSGRIALFVNLYANPK